MVIISWSDIRRVAIGIILVILPTFSLSYLIPHLKTYHLSESNLLELKKENVPSSVTEPLNEIGPEKFFFKYRLLSLIESRISNPTLYNIYENKIENQISSSTIWGVEYFFLVILGGFYLILWFFTRRFFPKGKI